MLPDWKSVMDRKIQKITVVFLGEKGVSHNRLKTNKE